MLKRPVGSDGAEASPVIVVSSQKPTSIPPPPSTHASVEMLIDEPDQRLLDALENQRDRLFVIKLEQDVIDFIEKNRCLRPVSFPSFFSFLFFQSHSKIF